MNIKDSYRAHVNVSAYLSNRTVKNGRSPLPVYCFIDPLHPGGEILVRCLLMRTTLTY